MDAEIMAACSGAKEMAWMEKLRIDIDEPTGYIPTLFMDNSAAVEWSKEAKFGTRAKHIEIQYYFIRDDMVLRDRLRVQHTPGTEQLADMLTKQLPAPQFEKLKREIEMATSC